jgi:hypothetical protein
MPSVVITRASAVGPTGDDGSDILFQDGRRRHATHALRVGEAMTMVSAPAPLFFVVAWLT